MTGFLSLRRLITNASLLLVLVTGTFAHSSFSELTDPGVDSIDFTDLAAARAHVAGIRWQEVMP